MQGYFRDVRFNCKPEFEQLFFVIRDLKVLMTCEDLELLTNLRDSTTPFWVILRRECCGRFDVFFGPLPHGELSVVYRDLFRYATCNMEPFNLGSISTALSCLVYPPLQELSGEKRGLLSRTAAGNRVYF